MAAPEKKRLTRAGWGLFALAILIVAFPLLVPVEARAGAFALELVCLTLFVLVAGFGITGLWRGALIDDRNQISLSRVQLLAWTIVVLGGFLTIALYNLGQTGTPLTIAIPGELWSLMGIGTASLVGSPLVRSVKEGQEPDQTESDRTIRLLASTVGGQPTDYGHRGLIIEKKDPKQASWTDLFMAEETGNAARLDLAKIQMFFFTAVLVIAYTFALGSLLGSGDPVLQEFPALTPGLVTLLGISHAGYLTSKALPHSKRA